MQGAFQTNEFCVHIMLKNKIACLGMTFFVFSICSIFFIRLNDPNKID